MTAELPSLRPLAPIVDQLRDIAREELPAPRSCRINLWDDGTFSAYIYHSAAGDEIQAIRYERTTGEILWERKRGCDRKTTEFASGETLSEPTYETHEMRVITTVEPPYE